MDSLPAEPPGKPNNAGVGGLSLLQQIFLTQESNWGLLHYRQILYQLSYRGSPVQGETDPAGGRFLQEGLGPFPSHRLCLLLALRKEAP